MKPSWIYLFLVVIALLLGGCARKSILNGRVLDRAGHPVGGASVQIVGTSLKTVTDQTGVFHLTCHPGRLALHLEEVHHLSKNIALDLPEAVTHTLPPTLLLDVPSTTEAENALRRHLASTWQSKSPSHRDAAFEAWFSLRKFTDTELRPGEDRYMLTTLLTLVSKRAFIWGSNNTVADVESPARFKEVVGGFALRSYPPGYTFTRALAATVTFAGDGTHEQVEMVVPVGTPGEDALPPSHDFARFVLGRWRGSFGFEFFADGTWARQATPSSPPDATGRRWSSEADTLTLVELGHVTRYTRLAAGNDGSLTLWNQGPVTLMRLPSINAVVAGRPPVIPANGAIKDTNGLNVQARSSQIGLPLPSSVEVGPKPSHAP